MSSTEASARACEVAGVLGELGEQEERPTVRVDRDGDQRSVRDNRPARARRCTASPSALARPACGSARRGSARARRLGPRRRGTLRRAWSARSTFTGSIGRAGHLDQRRGRARLRWLSQALGRRPEARVACSLGSGRMFPRSGRGALTREQTPEPPGSPCQPLRSRSRDPFRRSQRVGRRSQDLGRRSQDLMRRSERLGARSQSLGAQPQPLGSCSHDPRARSHDPRARSHNPRARSHESESMLP